MASVFRSSFEQSECRWKPAFRRVCPQSRPWSWHNVLLHELASCILHCIAVHLGVTGEHQEPQFPAFHLKHHGCVTLTRETTTQTAASKWKDVCYQIVASFIWASSAIAIAYPIDMKSTTGNPVVRGSTNQWLQFWKCRWRTVPGADLDGSLRQPDHSR